MCTCVCVCMCVRGVWCDVMIIIYIYTYAETHNAMHRHGSSIRMTMSYDLKTHKNEAL